MTLLHPAIIYHCDLTKEPLQPHIFREVTVKGFNPSDYQTTQVRPLALVIAIIRLLTKAGLAEVRCSAGQWRPVCQEERLMKL